MNALTKGFAIIGVVATVVVITAGYKIHQISKALLSQSDKELLEEVLKQK